MDKLATTLRGGKALVGALLTDKAGETTLASVVLYAGKEAVDSVLEIGATTAAELLFSGLNALASVAS